MSGLIGLLEGEPALFSGLITALTGILTGPVFHMNPSAVGSITAAVVMVFNLWVRMQVYTKAGAVNAATSAATQAVAAVSGATAGAVGEVTKDATAAIQGAVQTVLGAAPTIPPPGV
jgi:polygalacturonase